MDARSFYGRKRKNVTVRMAGGDEGESDEEVMEDSDSEYTPETELIGNQSALTTILFSSKNGEDAGYLDAKVLLIFSARSVTPTCALTNPKTVF